MEKREKKERKKERKKEKKGEMLPEDNKGRNKLEVYR